jgi:DNA anti-recombination protein RmuC
VPNTLDVAKQRKLIEDLKREGQTTQDAESRLNDMLDFLRSVRGYRGDTVNKLRQKSRHVRDRPLDA